MKLRIFCALILIIGVAPFVHADWWAVAIGQIEVLIRESLYTDTYQTALQEGSSGLNGAVDSSRRIPCRG